MDKPRPYRRRAVTLVNRAYSKDPRERVATIGGVQADRLHWKLSQDAAIKLIEAGSDEFYVVASDGAVKLVVLTHGGQKYLQTEREKTHPDDLLTLCPMPGRGGV
ncbi:MAG: hypothetical protein RL077_964 [Verrucomicrobiota bacterium]|jgi:hypothetical protein